MAITLEMNAPTSGDIASMRLQLMGVIFGAMVALPLGAQLPCVGHASVISVDSVSFLVKAPPGWMLDCEAGKAQGPLTVLYREGESWREGRAVMYVSTLTDRGAVQSSNATRISAEAEAWARNVADAKIGVGRPLPTSDGGGPDAAVRYFRSPKRQLFEAVAYVPRGRIMPLLTMTARSEQAFKEALPAFRLLVESYTPATLRVVP